jgi:hypothetical protein
MRKGLRQTHCGSAFQVIQMDLKISILPFTCRDSRTGAAIRLAFQIETSTCEISTVPKMLAAVRERRQGVTPESKSQACSGVPPTSHSNLGAHNPD